VLSTSSLLEGVGVVVRLLRGFKAVVVAQVDLELVLD
jgi:hypothetical protein